MDLEGNTSDWAFLDSLDQVSGEAGDFISHSLGGEKGDFTQNFLVEVEIGGDFGIVFLDENLGGLLNGLCSNSSLQSYRISSTYHLCLWIVVYD